jgi:hypothetical protein
MTVRNTRNDAAEAARRAREAERQREIERQREAAKKAAAEAAQKAAQKAAQQQAEKSVEHQNAARQVFAAQGAGCVDDPRRLQPATSTQARRGISDESAVQNGTKKIADAAARVERADSDDDKRAAARDAAKAVKDAVAQARDPAAKKAILDASQHHLETIGKGLDKLSGDDTKAAVADLADAAESAGPGGAASLAAPLARSMPALVEGHGDNKGEFLDGLSSAVEGGHGALLGAAMSKELAGVDGGLADDVNGATAKGLDALKSDFDDASEAAHGKDAELAAISSQWSGVLTPEQMKAGTESFQQDHGEYAERDEKAAALTKALAGAGYADANGVGGDLGDKSRETLEQVPALAQTDVGARAIGDALVKEGRGEQTFMQGAGRVAGRDDKASDEFAEAAQRSILTTQADALSKGDTRGLVTALRGAGQVLPDAGSRDDFNRLALDVEKQPPGTPPDKLAVAIASSARSIAGGVSDQKTAGIEDVDSISTKTSFKVFGASLGAVALGQSVVGFRDGVSAREGVNAVVNAAGLGSSVAGIALKEGAPKLLQKGLPVVGYALSAFDTVSAIKKGDELGAVAAAAPLAGAAAGAAIGAASGSIAPGVGTAIGGAAGALVGLGIGVGRQVFSDSPDEKLEKSTQSFLKGALQEGGLSEEQADKASYRLRDVNGDFFGAGNSLRGIAAKTGESPQQVLAKVANLDDDRLHDFVKQSLEIKDNGEAIRDAEQKVSEGKAAASSIPAYALDDAGLDALVATYLSL